jgi:hypothetical protein
MKRVYIALAVLAFALVGVIAWQVAQLRRVRYHQQHNHPKA